MVSLVLQCKSFVRSFHGLFIRLVPSPSAGDEQRYMLDCINGFALTQIPGVLARLDNFTQRNSLLTKPHLLRWALGIRKHVGLLSLWFLVIHILMRYDLGRFLASFLMHRQHEVLTLYAFQYDSLQSGLLQQVLFET